MHIPPRASQVRPRCPQNAGYKHPHQPLSQCTNIQLQLAYVPFLPASLALRIAFLHIHPPRTFRNCLNQHSVTINNVQAPSLRRCALQAGTVTNYLMERNTVPCCNKRTVAVCRLVVVAQADQPGNLLAYLICNMTIAGHVIPTRATTVPCVSSLFCLLVTQQYPHNMLQAAA